MITSLIVAAAANDVIGKDGTLPWRLPGDLRRFRALTSGHVVVMGRRTHVSILARLGRPLPDRTSVVLTHADPSALGPGVSAAGSVGEALTMAAALAGQAGQEEVFVIGGACVYGQALPYAYRVYLTRVHRDVAGDTEMPAGWLDGFQLTRSEHVPGQEPDGGYSFLDYQRARA